MIELIPLFMFLAICGALMLGYPVAFTLAGVSLFCAALGIVFGVFDPDLLRAYPKRIFGTMTNVTLVAVPLFVLMGVTLERSKIAEDLLENMAKLFGRMRGGLGISVVIVGAMLAASTGIVGATVVTMGLMSLPTMLKKGYKPELATGVICATGTLGQIIPPSIALILLGDIIASAYQLAQLKKGVFDPNPISVGDIFVAAIVPGLLLVSIFIIYLFVIAVVKPEWAPSVKEKEKISWPDMMKSLAPPLLLIILVLGSILTGNATPTEASAIGAVGALVLAAVKRQLSIKKLTKIARSSTEITCMVFAILVGASLFSLVFRGFGGDELISQIFNNLPGGLIGAVLVVMVVIFLLGFILDFIEITFVVVPIVAPVLFAMGMDPLLLAILIAMNLQTSFLTPPFGFALFYLRGVAPDELPTVTIYRGVIPFIAIQLFTLLLLAIWPSIVTWLPGLYN